MLSMDIHVHQFPHDITLCLSQSFRRSLRRFRYIHENCRDCESFLMSTNRSTVMSFLCREQMFRDTATLFQKVGTFEIHSSAYMTGLDQRPGASHINK